MQAVSELRNPTCRFGDLVAVDHAEFEVRQGELFEFLSPKGGGKTTTVRMLTGVTDRTECTARVPRSRDS